MIVWNLRAGLDPRGLAVVGGQERAERQVGDEPDPAEQHRDAEGDAEDRRVDAERAAEAAGHAPDVFVGGRAGELRTGRLVGFHRPTGCRGGGDPAIGDHPREPRVVPSDPR